MKLNIAITFLYAAASPAVASAILKARASACVGNLDNLARCFKASPSLATPYCSSFLAIPTVTVTRTSTPTAYATLPQIVSTETDVVSSTTITTSQSLVTSTTVETTYTTTTYTDILPAKRDLTAAKASPTALACLTAVNSKSFTSSVSSACGCLSIAPLTVFATSTANTYTSTVLTPATTTTSTTTVVVSVTVVPTTIVTTSVVTDTTTTTTTSTSAGHPTCTPNYTLVVDGQLFAQSFTGSGVREPLDNPAADGVTPDVTTFPGTLNDCDAITSCINYGFLSANNDYTYDIHYLISEGVWSCTGYYQGSSTNYFTISDSDVGAAYGYYAAA